MDNSDSDRAMMDNLYPLFRRVWHLDEEPIAVLGTAKHCGNLMILVRIETPGDDVEAIQKNPTEGLNGHNLRITLSPAFQVEHAQMLIKYYESKMIMMNDAKTKEEKAEDAARARLLHGLKDHDLRYKALYRDMMKDLPEHLKAPAPPREGQVGDGAGCSTSATGAAEVKETPQGAPGLLDEEDKMKLLQLHNQGPKQVKEGESGSEEELDEFGLPVKYWYSDLSDCSSDSDNN